MTMTPFTATARARLFLRLCAIACAGAATMASAQPQPPGQTTTTIGAVGISQSKADLDGGGKAGWNSLGVTLSVVASVQSRLLGEHQCRLRGGGLAFRYAHRLRAQRALGAHQSPEPRLQHQLRDVGRRRVVRRAAVSVGLRVGCERLGRPELRGSVRRDEGLLADAGHGLRPRRLPPDRRHEVLPVPDRELADQRQAAPVQSAARRARGRRRPRTRLRVGSGLGIGRRRCLS